MGTVPTPVNSAIATADIFEGMTEEAFVTMIETLLDAQFPFLALPIVKQIIDFAIEHVAAGVLAGEEKMMAKAIIKIQTALEDEAYQKALSSLIQVQDSGDADAIAKATQAAKDKFDSLVHSDGS